MFVLNEDLSIYATRGDIVFFSVSAEDDGVPYMFKPGDVVRIKVFGKKDAQSVVLEKDFGVTEETEEVEIFLDKEDTKIGEVISKPKDYWYEIELNPYSKPQTIIGYDEDGAKVFKLFPEGADIPALEPAPEDIPFIDDELDMVSTRPVQNQAIARDMVRLRADITAKNDETAGVAAAAESAVSVERARIDNLVAHNSPTISQPLEYLESISQESKARIDGTINSDGVSATIELNLREANLVFCGTDWDVFIIPNACRPIDTGLICSLDGMEYRINYDNVNHRYVLNLRAKDSVEFAPSGAGSVIMRYALGDCELKDIRVGADGKIYDSAGTAVRQQLAKVQDDIKRIDALEGDIAALKEAMREANLM